MKCSNCGVDVINGAEFCGNCGNKLSQNSNLQQLNNQMELRSGPDNNQTAQTGVKLNNDALKPNNLKKFIIILIIIVVCIGTVLVVRNTLLNNSNNENAYENGNSEESSNDNNKVFTIIDPLNHTITIKDDDISVKEVDLEYLYREADSLSEKASRLTEGEVENMNVSDNQKQAFKMAISYLSHSGFSYSKLISQLEYEKFSHDDSVYVADNSKIDWNEQALISAKTMLAAGGKSEKELREALIYDKFDEQQADYAIKNANADYYEQAVYQACFFKYSSNQKYDKDFAAERLESRGYKEDEIKFAIDTVYEKMK